MKSFSIIFLVFLLKQSVHGDGTKLTTDNYDTLYGLSITFLIVCAVLLLAVLIVLPMIMRSLGSENDKSYQFKHDNLEMHNDTPYYGGSRYKSKTLHESEFQSQQYQEVSFSPGEGEVKSFQNDAYVRSL